jgi:arylsulfatase A
MAQRAGTMRTALSIFAVLSTAPLVALCAADLPEKNRNKSPALEGNPDIVLILADDLGYGDVACCNPQSKVPTPNFDRLAREGMRFTDAHSPATACTPSRHSLITG